MTREVSLYGFVLGRFRPVSGADGAVLFWTEIESLDCLVGRHESREKLYETIVATLTDEQFAAIAAAAARLHGVAPSRRVDAVGEVPASLP